MTTDDHDTTWIRRFHPAPQAATALVCLPHAGGSASFFFPVSRALAPAVEVLAVQYPGRQDRRLEPAVEDPQELADLVYAALLPSLRARPGRPVALFGHSMGALLAFEVARRLEERAGIEPAALFVSGRRSPSIHVPETLHLAGDQAIVRELAALRGTQPSLLSDEEFLEMVLPALRSDYKLVADYRCPPGATVACPVVALTGDADPKAPVAEVRAWSRHTTGPFRAQVFPGDHFYLVAEGEAVIGAIASELASPAVA